MLTGIHFLLTYTCLYQCDHCFLYCSPSAEGTFTFDDIAAILDDGQQLGSVEWVYFEGGEPFLFYPLMLQGIRAARDAGFQVGVVTNAYWATSAADAEIWLKPLQELGVADLSMSEDAYHNPDGGESSVQLARQAAENLGIPADVICIEKPCEQPAESGEKGAPVVGGSTLFKGRAVDKLTEGLPRQPWDSFTECPHEDFQNPGRVHIDPFGNVFICQGLSIGNVHQQPLSQLMQNYRVENHPVCGPLHAGGPAELTRQYTVSHDNSYVDACHLCFTVRKALIDKFPQYLTPKHVYGIS
jgi:MoaA/NifB/PqqE/SkfB family radical SAM enzyme